MTAVPISDLSLVEERVVRLILAGRRLDEIAAELGAELPLVDWHVSQALRKLEKVSGMHSRLTRALLGEPRPGSARTTGRKPNLEDEVLRDKR